MTFTLYLAQRDSQWEFLRDFLEEVPCFWLLNQHIVLVEPIKSDRKDGAQQEPSVRFRDTEYKKFFQLHSNLLYPMAAQEDKKTVHIVLEVSLPDDDHSEDVDGRPKEFEQDVAGELETIPGVELDHEPKNTGTKQGQYSVGGVAHRVQPDITGTYYGQRFVVDTKLKENSYVDRHDVNKLYRDGAVLRAKPVMIHSGGMISEEKIADMEAGGMYIPVHYQKRGWRTELRDNFVAGFQ